MDISCEYGIEKRCFKCDQTVLNNLNIVCNAFSKTMLLWNQFQIFVYENREFESATLSLYPNFQIYDLIFSDNFLVCLDSCGNTHTTTLNLKNSASKSLIHRFQLCETGIVAGALYEKDHILFLKQEAQSYFLCLHKINAELQLLKNLILIYNEHLPEAQTNDKIILKVQLLTENNLESMKKVFNAKDWNDQCKYNLIVVTIDKHNIYGCLFSSDLNEEQASLVKLYTSPSEICDIQVIESGELSLIIGLTIGTIIKLPLNNLKTPQIIHLNIAIHKFLTFNETILYTDGKSMWKAENIISKNIQFSKYFVKHVKDFKIIEDQIICTTFMNLIYRFSIDDAGTYLNLESSDEYCPAEKILNNSEYLEKILEQVKQNETLIEKLNIEKDYITALSLSNRQDIMDNIINLKVIVYENYEDAITENKNVILTNNFNEYIEDSFFFLIKISTTTEHKLGHILSNFLGDLRVHITFATATKVIRTISIKVAELSKKISFLIPFKTEAIDITEMNVNIKILSNIPGALDSKQKMWTILYRKSVKLHSEHFIKFNLNFKKLQCLKYPQVSLKALILQAAANQHEHLFQFHDILRHKQAAPREWHMYVRLPDKYQEVFRNKDHTKLLTSKKVKHFLQQFTSEDFLKSRSNLIFSIGHEHVKIEIYNDSFSSPLLKLSGENIKIVLNIRNFLSDLIYCVFENFASGKEFISLSSYASVENLQKAVRKCITSFSEEEIEPLIESFERNVIGVLPI